MKNIDLDPILLQYVKLLEVNHVAEIEKQITFKDPNGITHIQTIYKKESLKRIKSIVEAKDLYLSLNYKRLQGVQNWN